MEIMGNLRHLGPIRAHHSFIDPMVSFEEIMRHMPQSDTQDRERDNPHSAGPENLIYLYGFFNGGALALGGGLAFKSDKPKCLRIFLTGGSIAQNVVVSDSTFGSILPGIRNLAIACIYHKPDKIFDINQIP